MNAREIIDFAQQHGVQVSIDGDCLHLEAQQQPPTNLIDLLRKHKADLLAYLASQPKHPTHHTGAYVALTANQSRALAGFHVLLQRRQQTLIKCGHNPSQALVRVEDWHKAVMRRLELNRDQMCDLERSLVLLGMIKIDNHRYEVRLGDNQPLTTQQYAESRQLVWEGYDSFSDWLYS